MAGIPTDHLAEDAREMDRRLTAAIDGMRAETAKLGAIANDVAWIKKLGWAVFGGVIAGVLTLIGQAFYVGSVVGRIETVMANLQKTTDEIRTDIKARDKTVADSLEDIRKSNDEIRIVVKGHSADMTRMQSSLDHLTENFGQMRLQPKPR